MELYTSRFTVGIFLFLLLQVVHSAMKELPESLKDSQHGAKMGEVNSICDDAEDSDKIDWDESAVNYTCYQPRLPLLVDKDINYILTNDVPPSYFTALHKCMSRKLAYKDVIPTYGHHRPNWAVYGEYQFLPPQRWLHNLEHGAVILLYHPCVMQSELAKAKKILKDCLYKHVISASNQLSTFRPICFVVWGHKLEMNSVDEAVVEDFIKSYAHKAPEGNLFVDGEYQKELIEEADYPFQKEENKRKICPEN